jgi:PKHD-type hydroxylase
MDYQIFSILDNAQVARVVEELGRRRFVDGRATASGVAREVKHNLQAESPADSAGGLEDTVRSALAAHSGLQFYALPKRILRPIFSRYEPGMEYGAHVDSALMTVGGEQARSDLAMTLFLSDPESYDGGELRIELAYGEEEIKLPAGEAVVYPASSLHRVAPVTRGVRLAAVTWMQSAVRDDRMRAILFDLHCAVREAEEKKAPVLRILKAYHNLLRLVSEL